VTRAPLPGEVVPGQHGVPWTAAEDARLLELVRRHRRGRGMGMPWVRAGRELNRTPASARSRYQQLRGPRGLPDARRT
jgi:hypothetical protein